MCSSDLMQTGLTVLAWSPLAGGRLATGDGCRPELVATLDRLAAERGIDRGSIALAFVLAHPSAPVAIIGTQQASRVTDAARAASLSLTRADVYAIIEASEGVPLP